MSCFWIKAAGILGALGVCLGAFAAHALREKLPPDLLVIFETGVRYHLFHTLALLGVAILSFRFSDIRLLHWSAGFLTVGVLIFSGSLYILALSGVRMWGAVTPFGGVALIIGWICLGLSGRTMGRKS